MRRGLGFLILLVISGGAFARKPLVVRIRVQADQVVRTMQGGIGASFHAMETPMGRRPSGGHIGGSAWGANPPAEDEAAWQSVYRHADWLGLDFCRVELEQRMYEPQRRRFSWDNPEMRILYRILDWAEKSKSDVFLQQMWSNIAWNAFPTLRDDAVGRAVSGPLTMDDFAHGLGELAEHLIRVKGYRSIRWLSITNEPGHDWSWWQGPDGKPLPLAPGLAAIRRELDRRGLDLPLSGPDWTDLPRLEPSRIDFDASLGAYDLHSYNAAFDGMNCGYPLSEAEERLSRWARWAHERGKPLFLSELGTMAYGWRDDDPGPGLYESGLKDAALVVRGIRAGVDGFNRWSFLNRGDLDGQWQLVDSWDIDEGRLRTAVTPHPNTYYLYGLLSRFTARHSGVLPVAIDPASEPGARQLVTAALRSPKGNLTVLAVNETYRDVDATLSVSGAVAKLFRYAITPAARDQADVTVRPGAAFSTTAEFRDRIPALSVVVYSTYQLSPQDPGITAE